MYFNYFLLLICFATLLAPLIIKLIFLIFLQVRMLKKSAVLDVLNCWNKVAKVDKPSCSLSIGIIKFQIQRLIILKSYRNRSVSCCLPVVPYKNNNKVTHRRRNMFDAGGAKLQNYKRSKSNIFKLCRLYLFCRI